MSYILHDKEVSFTEREQKGQMTFVRQMSEKRDSKSERIKVTRSITWQRLVNENRGGKLDEIVSDFIEKK